MIYNTEEITKQYVKLLKPLFDKFDGKMKPATKKQISHFIEYCKQRNVPASVYEQLAEFYAVTNNCSGFDSFDFHKIDDEILFEWWEDDKQLWLGSRDDDILSWCNDSFCLGDASNINFDDDYKFQTLIELLQKVIEEWFSDND
jgi:hypothetical protein